jgi:hypothetical protein
MTASVLAAAPPSTRQRRLKRRHLWLVPGLAIAFFASGQAPLHDVGIAYLILFGVAPHVPAWLPRSRRTFNLFHNPVPVAAIAAVAWVGLLPPMVMIGSLAWLSHIVIDWALGDGVRHVDGSRRGWLA